MNGTKSFARFLHILLAFVLAATLVPTLAYTEEFSGDTHIVDQLIESGKESVEMFEATGNVDDLRDRSAYQGESSNVAVTSSYPTAYDLRDLGVVTSVKFQNPWGTCWGFGAIAASEISIMSELGWTVDTNEIDLSELQLAWFSYMPLPADAGSQAGEGVYTIPADSAGVLNQGGFPFTATSVFSSGVGPVSEVDVPYKNKEDLVVLDSQGDPYYYYSNADWSVDESLRFAQVLELEESSVLPSPSTRDESGNYVYDPAGTAAIKEELMAGRGVEIAFCADTSRPAQADPPVYINPDTWAHYTFDKDAGVNHAVTIVGWNDTYSADNFLAGRQPSSDGAWIVKNSWGWKDGVFPNRSESGWGIDGNGYFYLSYYDMSISLPESFDFYTETYGQDAEYYLVDQYDYMPANSVTSVQFQDLVAMANVFEAGEDQLVRSLSCETANPDTTVSYKLYLLNEEFLSPEDGTLLTTVTETYTFGGFHRIQLDEGFPIKEGQHYSVIVTQQNGSGYEILTDRSLNEAGMNYLNVMKPGENYSDYAVGVINEGESFLYEEGEWSDWLETVEVLKQEDVVEPFGTLYDYDNFAIKAFADPIVIPRTVVVPDLANMTEDEAISVLESLSLIGQAGAAEYSDTVEAGHVIRQDTPAGTTVDEGYLVTYYLSLGKEPAPAPSESDDLVDPETGSLVKTGDIAMPFAAVLSALALICALVGAISLRRCRRGSCSSKG